MKLNLKIALLSLQHKGTEELDKQAYLADGTICSDDGEEALLQMSGDELVVVVVKWVEVMVVTSDREVGEPILSMTSFLAFSFEELLEGLVVVVAATAVGEQTG